MKEIQKIEKKSVSKHRLKTFFAELGEKLNPTPIVGGFSISDVSIKYLSLKNNSQIVAKSALRLPPGIIKNGELIDEANFAKALNSIKKSLNIKGNANIVLNLSQSLVFTQSFSMPLISESELSEALNLNMQMVSPINFEDAIYDSEKIGEYSDSSSKVEYLGAFANKSAVEKYIKIFKICGFYISAIEFPSLSLVRLIETEARFKKEESYIFLDIVPEGISLLAIKNFKLYFNHFHNWQSVMEEMGEKQISKIGFNNFIVQEIKKVTNFFSSHFSSSVDSLIISSSSKIEGMEEMLKNNFSFNIEEFNVSSIEDIDASWLHVLGSARRGLISRHNDVLISLTNEPVKIEFFRNRVFALVRLWRKLYITVFSFSLIAFLIVDVYLVSIESDFKIKAEKSLGDASISKAMALEVEVKKFNSNLDLLKKADDLSFKASDLLFTIYNMLPGGLYIDGINLNDNIVSVFGSAASENLILAFKENGLTKEKRFYEISLPLTNIKPDAGGRFRFSASFKFKREEF
ncbi:MAG: hypothetical protein EXS49_01410 [Candidatus Pacebacteria bacterium]|nr:hypothetical protein [Candidatus Paceibacterota bacterium]